MHTSLAQHHPQEPSNFDPQPPPPKAHPGHEQQHRAAKQHAPSKCPQRRETPVIQYRAANRRANQHPQRHNRETLSQSRPNLLPLVLTQPHNDSGGQTDEAAGEEAVERHQDADAGRAVDGDVADAEDGGDEAAGDDDVEGSQPVGEDVGHDAAEDGGRVHDGQEVEGEVLVGQVGLQRVELRVEEGHVQPHEPAEEARDLEAVGGDGEGLQVEQGARF